MADNITNSRLDDFIDDEYQSTRDRKCPPDISIPFNSAKDLKIFMFKTIKQ